MSLLQHKKEYLNTIEHYFMSATGRFFFFFFLLQKRGKCYNLNANYPFFSICIEHDQLLLFCFLQISQREEGWIAECLVTSHKVPKGGHLSFFSLFLSLIFCLKIFFIL